MKGAGWVIGVVVVIFLAVLFNQPPPPEPTPTDDDYQFTVMVVCENLVKKNLKSPASMKVPHPKPSPVQVSSGVWRYTFPVDAQNGFGALIRSTWRCDVANGQVTVQELQ